MKHTFPTRRSSDLHESVIAQGDVAILDGHFLHYPYASLEAFIGKINLYSTEAALILHQKGRRTSVAGACGHAAWTFARHYIVRRGFLDGRSEEHTSELQSLMSN